MVFQKIRNILMKEFGIREVMNSIIETLEKKHAIKMLLLIFDEIAYKKKIRNDLDIPNDTIDLRLKEFKEIGLLLEPKIQNNFPFRKIYPLTEKGEHVACKLSYVFDEDIRTIPITEDLYKKLKGAIELYEAKGMTVDVFVNELIKKYLKTTQMI